MLRPADAVSVPVPAAKWGELMMRICVLPADGQGATLAGVLALAGAETTLVAEPARAQAIAAGGLVVETPQARRIARIDAVDRAPEQRFDLVVVSGRPSAMAATLALAAPALARAHAVCSIQNSVDFDVLRHACPAGTLLLGASVTEFFAWTADNVVRADRPTDVDIYVGVLDERPEAAELADRLAAAVSAGGLVARRSGAIRQVIWEKQLQLANAAGWSALTLLGDRALTLCDGLATTEGAEQFVATASELLLVYRAMGYEAQDFFGPRSLLGTIAQAASPEEAVVAVAAAGQRHLAAGLRVRTPMHDDILNRRKTEADAILRPFIEQGARRGIATPLTSAAYRAIKLWERWWEGGSDEAPLP